MDDIEEQSRWMELDNRLERARLQLPGHDLAYWRNLFPFRKGIEPQNSIIIGNIFAFWTVAHRHAINDRDGYSQGEFWDIAQRCKQFAADKIDSSFLELLNKRSSTQSGYKIPESLTISPKNDGYLHLFSLDPDEANSIVMYLESPSLLRVVQNLIATESTFQGRPDE